MSDFWTLSNGEPIVNESGVYDQEKIQPIPDDTQCLCVIDGSKWIRSDEYGDHVDVVWKIIDGTYINRKVWQKIRLNSTEPKKADKAKKMLAAIDKNAGGTIVSSGKMPEDHDLARELVGKIMLVKFGVWEIADKGLEGNWVKAVNPSNATPPASIASSNTPPVPTNNDVNDEIPF